MFDQNAPGNSSPDAAQQSPLDLVPPKPKRFFGGVPGRALRDRRLTAQDVRNLGVIASHDQMSIDNANGQGAWASLKTMADEALAEYTRFTKSVQKLLALGYLERDRLKKDRRRWTYRVIYIDADKLPSKKVVGPTANYLPEHQGDGGREIVDRTANHSPKGSWLHSQRIRHSVETVEDIRLKPRDLDPLRQARDEQSAPLSSTIAGGQPQGAQCLAEQPFTNVGAWLAQVERAMKAGQPLDYDSVYAQLDEISDNHLPSKLGMQAMRLMQELAEYEEAVEFDDVLY